MEIICIVYIYAIYYDFAITTYIYEYNYKIIFTRISKNPFTFIQSLIKCRKKIKLRNDTIHFWAIQLAVLEMLKRSPFSYAIPVFPVIK